MVTLGHIHKNKTPSETIYFPFIKLNIVHLLNREKEDVLSAVYRFLWTCITFGLLLH